MSLDHTHDELTFVQVMIWYRQSGHMASPSNKKLVYGGFTDDTVECIFPKDRKCVFDSNLTVNGFFLLVSL